MRKRWSKTCLFGIAALICVIGFSGCYIVEPEKRAYPLVVGIDWAEGEYRVYLAMAQLAKSTGQGKEGGEEQEGDGTGALVLTGTSGSEIEEKYNQSRELYLDPGHIQAVIFGDGLRQEEEKFFRVLEEMERDPSLGNSAYVFQGENLEAIFEANGVLVESIGKFLTGVYENRTEKKEKPVTLAAVYRQLHNQGRVSKLDEVVVDSQGLWVKNSKTQEISVQKELSEQVLRFHVLANSDSQADQEEKLLVRDVVLEEIRPLLEKTTSRERAKETLTNCLEDVERVAETVTAPRKVKAELVTDWFPEKTYGELTFPEGEYEALRLEIGEAKGHNWWCVLYPSLCFTEAVKPVMTEEGKEKLQLVLEEDTYEFLQRSGKRKIRYRWLSFMEET